MKKATLSRGFVLRHRQRTDGASIHALIGPPGADQHRHLGQGIEHHGDVRPKAVLRRGPAKQRDPVLEQVAIGVGDLYERFLAVLLEDEDNDKAR